MQLDEAAEDSTETQESPSKQRIPLVKQKQRQQIKSPDISHTMLTSGVSESAAASAGTDRKKRSSKKDKEREAEKEKLPVQVEPNPEEKSPVEILSPQSSDSDEQLVLDAYHSSMMMAKTLASNEEQSYHEAAGKSREGSLMIEDTKKLQKGRAASQMKTSMGKRAKVFVYCSKHDYGIN